MQNKPLRYERHFELGTEIEKVIIGDNKALLRVDSSPEGIRAYWSSDNDIAVAMDALRLAVGNPLRHCEQTSLKLMTSRGYTYLRGDEALWVLSEEEFTTYADIRLVNVPSERGCFIWRPQSREDGIKKPEVGIGDVRRLGGDVLEKALGATATQAIYDQADGILRQITALSRLE